MNQKFPDTPMKPLFARFLLAADTRRITAENRICKACALVAATLIPSSLRSMFLFTVLIVPQVLWGVASASATPPQTCLADKNETLWTPLPISASGSLKHQSRKPE